MDFESRKIRITLPADDGDVLVEPVVGDVMAFAEEGSTLCLGALSNVEGVCVNFWSDAFLLEWAPIAAQSAAGLASLREQLESRLAAVDEAQKAAGG